jgi:hypothetical protein
MNRVEMKVLGLGVRARPRKTCADDRGPAPQTLAPAIALPRDAGLEWSYQPSVNFPCSYWLMSAALARSVSLS